MRYIYFSPNTTAMSEKRWPRRAFIAAALPALPALAATSIRLTNKSAPRMAPPPTIQQVIDALLADIPGAPFPNTVDTIKSGDPTQPVKGIVTTMFATDAIIRNTISLGANFIIAHEPTFYNHTDETDWLSDDPVFRFKKNLLVLTNT